MSHCTLGVPELSPFTIHLDRALGIWGPVQMAQGLLSPGTALRGKGGMRSCYLRGLAASILQPLFLFSRSGKQGTWTSLIPLSQPAVSLTLGLLFVGWSLVTCAA